MLFLQLGKLRGDKKKKIEEAPQRLEQAKAVFSASGSELKALYAMLGPYDYVQIVECTDMVSAIELSTNIDWIYWETYGIVPFEELAKALKK